MTFSARVISGRARGRTLGVPTLNLDLEDVPADLAHGLYACRVTVNAAACPGTLHYGERPTFGDTESCEVHLIDRVLPEPPESVDVEIVKLLRSIEKFASAEALQKQMVEDICQARELLHDQAP